MANVQRTESAKVGQIYLLDQNLVDEGETVQTDKVKQNNPHHCLKVHNSISTPKNQDEPTANSYDVSSQI